MVFPGQAVTAVAAVLGLSENAVRVADEALRDAGLRTSGGRGRSAAHVSPLDVARLLIAVAAPGRLTDAIVAARVMGQSQRDESRQRDSKNIAHEFFALGGTGQIPETLEEVLVALIQNAADGLFDRYRQEMNRLELNVTLSTETIPTASISAFAEIVGEPIEIEPSRDRRNVLDLKVCTLYFFASHKGLEPRQGDLSRDSRFSQKTIFAVADLLRTQNEPD